MSQEAAISLKNISKVYKRYHQPIDRLKEALIPGKSKAEKFWALKDITLEIPRGHTVGIVGRNGSGKSTLLQIIAGTLQPTSGDLTVNGRVSALLELGSGFNPEFTGRQNVFFNGRILGLSNEEIENRFDDIASFADIGKFIEQPVKTYSSGMFVRLAFAVAVHVQPEVFIVDEALAVGDIVFQHKCMRRIKELMDSGVTTLFVSHDAGAVRSLCNYAYMLNNGCIHAHGKPYSVFIEYMKLVTQIELEQSEKELKHGSNTVEQKSLEQALDSGLEKRENAQEAYVKTEGETNSVQRKILTKEEKESLAVDQSRIGSGLVRIVNVSLFHEDGKLAISSPIFKFNEKVTLVVDIQSSTDLGDFILGFYVRDKNGNELIGSNTNEENAKIGELKYGDRRRVKYCFRLPLRRGGYSLTVAGAENYESTTCDWIDNAIVFKVLPPDDGKLITAFVDIPMNVAVEMHKEGAFS